jgi:hypothetical protein
MLALLVLPVSRSARRCASRDPPTLGVWAAMGNSADLWRWVYRAGYWHRGFGGIRHKRLGVLGVFGVLVSWSRHSGVSATCSPSCRGRVVSLPRWVRGSALLLAVWSWVRLGCRGHRVVRRTAVWQFGILGFVRSLHLEFVGVFWRNLFGIEI